MGAPLVFISYSRDTVEHQECMLGHADRLRADGINTEIDQCNATPGGLAAVVRAARSDVEGAAEPVPELVRQVEVAGSQLAGAAWKPRPNR